jgi:Response regulator containing a CheY-like receiver domain and an HTH DNA-binding domain
VGGQISILLVDQSRLFREGLKRIFQDSVFQVSHEAAALSEALDKLKSSPDTNILLTELPVGNAASPSDVIGAIRDTAPNTRIVVLTNDNDGVSLMRALDAGVDGYLLKSMSADALKQSLHLVMLGEKVFPTDLARCLVNGAQVPSGSSGTGRRTASGRGLSEREMQILNCLLGGDSNKMIANRLQISEGTVKVHLKGILKKINVQNRTQAAIWALNNGMAQTAQHSGLKA